MLLMPDHLHLVVTPYLGYDITGLITSWKRFLTRSYRLKFQRNFFEHRIRNSENFSAYCQYVRFNPVRAGLVTRPEDQRIGPGFIPGLLGRQMSNRRLLHS
jgi:putative transposase